MFGSCCLEQGSCRNHFINCLSLVFFQTWGGFFFLFSFGFVLLMDGGELVESERERERGGDLFYCGGNCVRGKGVCLGLGLGFDFDFDVDFFFFLVCKYRSFGGGREKRKGLEGNSFYVLTEVIRSLRESF